MCSRCDSINDAIESIHNTENFLRKLSDEEYAALDMSEEIKRLEWSINYKQEALAKLKERFLKVSEHVPLVPKGMNLYEDNFKNTNYRFRGHRDIEEKVYGYPKGYLTDDIGW